MDVHNRNYNSKSKVIAKKKKKKKVGVGGTFFSWLMKQVKGYDW